MQQITTTANSTIQHKTYNDKQHLPSCDTSIGAGVGQEVAPGTATTLGTSGVGNTALGTATTLGTSGVGNTAQGGNDHSVWHSTDLLGASPVL